jgi:hypothetical protein
MCSTPRKDAPIDEERLQIFVGLLVEECSRVNPSSVHRNTLERATREAYVAGLYAITPQVVAVCGLIGIYPTRASIDGFLRGKGDWV